jgi:hypothetical protein
LEKTKKDHPSGYGKLISDLVGELLLVIAIGILYFCLVSYLIQRDDVSIKVEKYTEPEAKEEPCYFFSGDIIYDVLISGGNIDTAR